MGSNKEIILRILLFTSLVLPIGISTAQEPGAAVQTGVPTEEIARLNTVERVTPEQAAPPAASRIEHQANGPGKEPKDLTAFFVIGFIINILAIGAFFYWAVRQWHKPK